MEQRSEEWFAERRGKVTASRIGDILNTIRSGAWAASRKHYAAQLVSERLSDKNPEPYTNEWIEWGIEQEAPAKEAYTKATGNAVDEVGFINHPTIASAGASPDGLIGEDGLLEIKCPATATHIERLLNEEIPESYMLQMLWQMACSGRKYVDFVSFDPRLPEDMQLFIKRIERDDVEIARVENEVRLFIEEVNELVLALENKFRS
jgi:putative phage-type endonuclease